MPQYPNERPAVENLQRYLRQLSYHQPIPPPPIDGIYAEDTEKALRAFQGLYGLPTTGRADSATWDSLYAAYRASIAKNSPPRPVYLFPLGMPDFILAPQSTGFLVAALQYMLRELSAVYTASEEVAISGSYNAHTEAAVRDFQSRNGLLPDGSVNLATWNAITDQYNSLFAANDS